MSRRRILAALAATLLLALPVAAQEQVGALEGRVTDSAGGVLPGATVEVSGPGVATLVSTTDARGSYRFPRVPPGVYTVTVRLEGFQPAETTGASVVLGQTKTVNFQLEVGEFTEEILVTGERAQIDVTQSATATSIAREQLELVPRGRDFTSVVSQAAGASIEPFLGGVSIDGASGSENRYVIDGTDVTFPRTGAMRATFAAAGTQRSAGDDTFSGQPAVADFLEEIQVKSAGYAAEFGGSIGGVINVVTKSGTNDYHGSLGAQVEDASWSGDERATPFEEDPSLYRTFDKDDATRIEPSASLGGPLARDNAWFYVGYQYSTEDIERTPDGSPATFEEDITRQYFVGNIKGNVGSRFLYKIGANLSPSERDGVLPAQNGSTPESADLSIVDELPTASYSAYADYVPSNNFYLSGRVGYYVTDREQSGGEPGSQFQFINAFPDLDDPRARPQGFTSIPGDSFFLREEDKFEKQQASLDGNYFVTGAGQHSFKVGVQYELIENNVNLGELNGNNFRLRWGLPRFNVIGDFGSVEVRSFRTIGSAESENLGLYLQDTWAIRPNLTLNLGVRTEQEKVPNYPVNVPEFGDNAIEFDFDEKVAPRVGFAWDVLSDQRWKVYGSYGTYYDITKLEMPRGSFGADHWIAYIYPLNTLDWESLDASCHTSTNDPADNPCPGLGTPVTVDFREATNPAEALDPDLKPMEQREWQIGLDHQLAPNVVIGARYVNKELQETIEDIGFLVEDPPGVFSEHFVTGNPGKGVVAGDPPGPVPAQPEAVREYQGVTLSFDRRFVDNWSLRASYTWSELEGNYSGLASSDEFGRTSPNVERYFDALHNGFDQNGRLVLGELTTDRPHVVNIQGLYQAPWGTTFGLNQYWGEGTPISEEVFYTGVPFFPNGRGNLGRTGDLTQTDLQITHPFRIGGNQLEVSLNVLNLFDEDTETRVQNRHYRTDLCDALQPACDFTQEFFFGLAPFDTDAIMTAAGAEVEPHFGKPLAFQNPRAVRLGVAFRF